MVPGTGIEPRLELEFAAIEVELRKVEGEVPHCLSGAEGGWRRWQRTMAN
jgi:hypothetical protein